MAVDGGVCVEGEAAGHGEALGPVRYLAVSPTTIKRMVATGLLSMSQAAPFAPWEIQRSALDAEPVRKVVAHLKKTGRLELPGEEPEAQQKLFQ